MNSSLHLSSENALNSVTPSAMKEDERSVSAPINGEKDEKKLDSVPIKTCFSTSNIDQQWSTVNEIEKLKTLLKNAPKYFEEKETNPDQNIFTSTDTFQEGSYALDVKDTENPKSPFALLVQSLKEPQCSNEDNVSINELVVAEYATEQEVTQKESNNDNLMKHNSIQTKTKKDVIAVGKPFFQSLMRMPSTTASTGKDLDSVDKKTRKVSSSLEDLKNDLKSTMKTLALILMYLLISLPTYITAAIHRNCYCAAPNGLQNCQKLREFMYVFDNVSLIGHIVFPCTWLFFDKMYSDKLLKTLRIIRDTR